MPARPFSPLPALVVHADWGSPPGKRWMARATLEGGRYRALPPEPVGVATTLVNRMRSMAGEQGAILFGFDFPIGVPSLYAERAGITDFVALLPELGQGRWADFFRVAETAEEISPHRPFYPQAPGNKKQEHLVAGLGVRSMDDLLRRCDQGHSGRGKASPMFWTLGGKQVGKAAILGWQEVVVPALISDRSRVKVWPFEGELQTLLEPGQSVIAETYPAEFYGHLGVRFYAGASGEKWGKRSQQGRQRNGPALLHWAETAEVGLDPVLSEAIQNGFGPSADGEDPFDAVVGLFGMLNIVLGYRESGEPDEEQIREVEGWMLGRCA